MSAALWVWAITLALVTIVVVPLALYLLRRALRAAKAIERYTRESLEAGKGIAGNTKAATALDETIVVATSLLEATTKLRERASAFESKVRPLRPPGKR